MRYLLLIAFSTLVITSCSQPEVPADTTSVDGPPNVVLIFVDDMGYGDLGCYGSNRIQTPHLDQLATTGLKLTNFYAFPLCSPSRAALLTGCYPPRVGIPDVVGPPGLDWTKDKQYGLHPDETTLPEILREAGYTTGMIGKWHLGHFPETMPTKQGFQTFFGLPYSNDMLPERGYPDLNLYDQENIVEANPDQRQLTKRYTERAVSFIQEQKDSPFFLYLAHAMPHVPLYTSTAFDGRNPGDPYADVIEEIDWSVGQVAAALDANGVRENTLIIFTSDNGPWLSYGDHAGSAGPFREGKGTTFEGGTRVPAIFNWPAEITPGSHNEVASLIDILPTLTDLADATKYAPSRKIDGRIMNLEASSDENSTPNTAIQPFYYWRSNELQAVRLGEWKLHVPHIFRQVERIGFGGEAGEYARRNIDTQLYNIVTDPGERYDRSKDYPEKVAELTALIEAAQQEMEANKRPAFYAASPE
ncbi:sulfatase [Lewinella sp. 4G2]|uniref:sulfatase family protein n=1 Tax=Lewinella sp. 4G2 TaxID=1803372 RepID=UPI0007B4635E|nr:sulfatase [Lewinella sp. 4G2]OAV44111.1 hypothetical protein A3850_006180 [Lewinella sp. 4G2]